MSVGLNKTPNRCWKCWAKTTYHTPLCEGKGNGVSLGKKILQTNMVCRGMYYERTKPMFAGFTYIKFYKVARMFMWGNLFQVE